MVLCERIELASGWTWAEHESAVPLGSESEAAWTPAAMWPSEIHVELMHADRIPDPYVVDNEHRVQWAGEREWMYRCGFDAPAAAKHVLEFEGLDTFCDVYLNDRLIASMDNMFRPYNVPITALHHDQPNILLLHFKSAKLIAKDLESKYGKVRAGSTNLGDPSRVYVRKAQYDWRWDWGPELMTCGPYRPIRLLAYTARLGSVNLHALVSEALNSSIISIITIEGPGSIVRVRLESLDRKSIIWEQGFQVEGAHAEIDVDLTGKVDLWWPIGSGAQTRYWLVVELLDEEQRVLDVREQSTGFRRIELVQEPLHEADQYGTGTTFFFRVNNVPIFVGGSNWIPADNFLTTITPARYRALLTLARDGGQNMIRVWGGGIYEPDLFYDLCDELGILVWQDFQFACGVYPAHDEFVESVRVEAEEAVRRLRVHPCLALFCGNNEDYQQVLQWGDVPDLPARVLYEDVLPKIVEAHAPGVPYHRGSPYGGKGWDTADPTVGDVHQWDVWAGKGLPYQDYDRLGGRFVSEFGVPAMPALRTVEHWLGSAKDDPRERRPHGRLNTQHCRAGAHQRRFATLLADNAAPTADLETHVFNTQRVQADALAHAYRSWRREWRGPGREFCGGALVWQLNDCWPVTSWAIVDYFHRPKPAYYAIKRELAPVVVGLFRDVTKDRPHDRPRQFYEFGNYRAVSAAVDVWAANGTRQPRRVVLALVFVDLRDPAWKVERECTTHVLAPNATTELGRVPVSAPSGTKGPDAAGATVVVGATLTDAETGELVARTTDWPQPYALLDVPDPGLSVEVDRRSDGSAELRVSVARPVKGLVLEALGDGDHEHAEEVTWSDNALDVMPGDVHIVRAQALGTRPVAVTYLGGEKAQRFAS